MAEQEQAVTYASGASRSKRNPRYRDIDFGLMKRIGEAFLEGAETYEKDMMPYEKNWKNGDLVFALDVLDHAIEHLFNYKEAVLLSLNGEVGYASEFKQEDHLGHLGANLVMLDYFDRRGFFDKANYETDEPSLDPDQGEDATTGAPSPTPWRESLRQLFGPKE